VSTAGQQPPPAVVHRALASPTRLRLLEVLRDSENPLSAQALADALDLHPNTVRNHLGILANAALVAVTVAATGGRGRPQHLYVACSSTAGTEDREGYEVLAGLLADRVVRDHADAEQLVEQATMAWAREQVALTDTGPDGRPALKQLRELLERLGFSTRFDEVNDDEVALVSEGCPLTPLAEHNPRIACSFHRGVVRGVLGACDGKVALDAFESDPGERRCRGRLRIAS